MVWIFTRVGVARSWSGRVRRRLRARVCRASCWRTIRRSSRARPTSRATLVVGADPARRRRRVDRQRGRRDAATRGCAARTRTSRTASRSRARPSDSYELTDADAGNAMRVTLWATEGDESSYKVSDPTAVVKTAARGHAAGEPAGRPELRHHPGAHEARPRAARRRQAHQAQAGRADHRPLHVHGRADHALHGQGAEGRDDQARVQQGHVPGQEADDQGRPHVAPGEVRAHAEGGHADAADDRAQGLRERDHDPHDPPREGAARAATAVCCRAARSGRSARR